ncbi:hypothetical protein [Butyrivibrio sp. YAB3001]|uniref:hypothetical protein n=1 Tax=Butyrivibrio sp. YAB3001 TaxID=1520812 RepID=UPI0008F61EFD|nr:hypothetical protein [Butyrivibrio sp. YAB3001]SFB68963.1 hypothetical protein SAMN02910398_00248 [Butyrivibrio sp. YAB3001]
MLKNKYSGIVAIFGLVLCLSGCGEAFPDLTQEQYDQTVEYAAGLLLKYSNNGQSKLTYVDAKLVQKEMDKEKAAAEASSEEASTKKTEQTSSKPKTSSESESKTEESSAQTQESESGIEEKEIPVEQTDDSGDASSEETPSTENYDPSEPVLSNEDTQEIVPGMFLSYQGYSISSTYPEKSKSYVINAEKGKKLLVLRFDLYNSTDADKNVNLLQHNILFQVLINGSNIGYTSVTVLPNDLSSFVGSIESKAHESLVVLSEIDESLSTEIKTLELVIFDGDQKETVFLK